MLFQDPFLYDVEISIESTGDHLPRVGDNKPYVPRGGNRFPSYLDNNPKGPKVKYIYPSSPKDGENNPASSKDKDNNPFSPQVKASSHTNSQSPENVLNNPIAQEDKQSEASKQALSDVGAGKPAGSKDGGKAPTLYGRVTNSTIPSNEDMNLTLGTVKELESSNEHHRVRRSEDGVYTVRKGNLHKHHRSRFQGSFGSKRAGRTMDKVRSYFGLRKVVMDV